MSGYAYLNYTDSVQYLIQFYENEFKQKRIEEGDYRFLQLSSLEFDSVDVVIEENLKYWKTITKSPVREDISYQ